jgi:putative ABC transport system substrate-binding protein
MNRRDFVAAIAVVAIGVSMAFGQQPSGKVPRVGVLSPAENAATPIFEAFRQGLREIGYVEGRNIILEFRFAQGDYALIQRLAEELVNLPVDVIVTDSGPAARAAASASRTIPIVIGTSGDAVAAGLVQSFARPGGNLTGFTLMANELSAKRVDLIRTAFPDTTAIAVLTNPSSMTRAFLRQTEEPARAVGLTVTLVDAASPEALRTLRPEALGKPGLPLMVLPDAMFWNHRREIIALAAAARVPALYPEREYADDGGLMAYGPSVPDNFRRAAGYVDRILRGEKPGDLPIQQPAKFDFIVNLKTAKELALTIPPLILARADEVIE